MDLQSLTIERRPSAPTPRRRNSAWLPRIVTLAVLAAAAWLVWPSATQWIDRLRLPAVRVYLVTEAAPAAAAAVRGTAANGYVVAARRAALSSDVPGRIVELNVTEGSVVQRGDVVARLFADDFRAAYERACADAEAATTAVRRAEAAVAAAAADVGQAEAALATARAQRDEAEALRGFAAQELARAEQLVTTGIENQRRREQARSEHDAAVARQLARTAGTAAAEGALQAAQKRLDVARVDVELARAQAAAAAAAREQARATLDKTDVRAPFDGVVVLKDAEVGEVVSPNAQGGSNARGAVCTMVDFDSLEVQANVPETTLSSVRVGAPADVFLDAFPDDRYEGKVDRIWPTADRQKATVEVRIRLTRKDERLRPEMGVRIVFRRDDAPPPDDAAAASRRIVVPDGALVQIDGRLGAFVVEQDRVRFAAVATGEQKGGRVAIDAGLTANQRIVLDPPTSLRDGDRVRVVEQ